MIKQFIHFKIQEKSQKQLQFVKLNDSFKDLCIFKNNNLPVLFIGNRGTKHRNLRESQTHGNCPKKFS